MPKEGNKPRYKTAKELEEKIEAYIDRCEENEKPLTYTGLAYHLGFASRQSIWEYSKRKDELSLPIKRAMLRIEQSYEENLVGNNATGSIFALKNRGWTADQDALRQISAGAKKNSRNFTVAGLQDRVEGYRRVLMSCIEQLVAERDLIFQ